MGRRFNVFNVFVESAGRIDRVQPPVVGKAVGCIPAFVVASHRVPAVLVLQVARADAEQILVRLGVAVVVKADRRKNVVDRFHQQVAVFVPLVEHEAPQQRLDQLFAPVADVAVFDFNGEIQDGLAVLVFFIQIAALTDDIDRRDIGGIVFERLFGGRNQREARKDKQNNQKNGNHFFQNAYLLEESFGSFTSVL